MPSGSQTRVNTNSVNRRKDCVLSYVAFLCEAWPPERQVFFDFMLQKWSRVL